MRFIDEASIKIQGGHGGPGCVSFRRETFAPRGGPDGGDGGKGGSVIFVASEELGTLQDFRYRRIYTGEGGHNGSSTMKAGRDGDDVRLRIPVGTIIKDTLTGDILVDFETDGQEWVAVKGGRGGKGNAHFTTSTHQAPKFAQPGEEGEYREITMELKLLADVGIIGFPNAGKSTLISRISAARPKIADYAFTTLTPNLGVVEMGDLSTFVVADFPGLIEGAHKGFGLGHKFLKHIERTQVFVHLLDGTQLLEDATKPDQSQEENFKAAIDTMINRYQIIRNELGLFNEKLLHKPEIVVLNKIDLLQTDDKLIEKAQTALRQRIASIRGTHPIQGEPFVISAFSGTGVQDFVYTIHSELMSYRAQLNKGKTQVRLPDDVGIRHSRG